MGRLQSGPLRENTDRLGGRGKHRESLLTHGVPCWFVMREFFIIKLTQLQSDDGDDDDHLAVT